MCEAGAVGAAVDEEGEGAAVRVLGADDDLEGLAGAELPVADGLHPRAPLARGAGRREHDQEDQRRAPPYHGESRPAGGVATCRPGVKRGVVAVDLDLVGEGVFVEALVEVGSGDGEDVLDAPLYDVDDDEAGLLELGLPGQGLASPGRVARRHDTEGSVAALVVDLVAAREEERHVVLEQHVVDAEVLLQAPGVGRVLVLVLRRSGLHVGELVQGRVAEHEAQVVDAGALELAAQPAQLILAHLARGSVHDEEESALQAERIAQRVVPCVVHRELRAVLRPLPLGLEHLSGRRSQAAVVFAWGRRQRDAQIGERPRDGAVERGPRGLPAPALLAVDEDHVPVVHDEVRLEALGDDGDGSLGLRAAGDRVLGGGAVGHHDEAERRLPFGGAWGQREIPGQALALVHGDDGQALERDLPRADVALAPLLEHGERGELIAVPPPVEVIDAAALGDRRAVAEVPTDIARRRARGCRSPRRSSPACRGRRPASRARSASRSRRAGSPAGSGARLGLARRLGLIAGRHRPGVGRGPPAPSGSPRAARARRAGRESRNVVASPSPCGPEGSIAQPEGFSPIPAPPESKTWSWSSSWSWTKRVRSETETETETVSVAGPTRATTGWNSLRRRRSRA